MFWIFKDPLFLKIFLNVFITFFAYIDLLDAIENFLYGIMNFAIAKYFMEASGEEPII